MLNKKIKILSTALYILCILGMLVSIGFADSPSIVRYSSDWPVIIDPAVALDCQSHTALVNLYDALVITDKEGNPVPHIAKSWDISSDGLTYTFYLREGVKFHDGSELTAEDVKFSMDRMLTIGEGVAYIWFEKIKEVEAPDKYTVVFHMKNTFGPFLVTLPSFFIVNKDLVMANIKTPGMYGDMGDYGKEYMSNHDAGSGPYMLKEFGQADILMEKSPNYFLDISSAPDEFKMIGSTESALLKTLMVRRELEMTNRWLTPETLDALAKIEGVEIARWLYGNMDYITMNTKKPPLDDIHVRKALAWAFDYDTAVELTTGSVQARGPVPLTVPGSDPNCFQYHRDLEKAKEELMKSKYYGHFDEYPMECIWHSNISKEKIALLFMANAAEIGLTVNVEETTWPLLASACASIETTPHFYVITDSVFYPDAGALLQARYHSMTAGTWEQGEWLLDPVLDEMIEDALCTVSNEERYTKYSEITKYIIDLCPSIFIIEAPDCRAYQAYYMDWPAARGDLILSYKYDNCIRFIKVYPEKREELLKKGK